MALSTLSSTFAPPAVPQALDAIVIGGGVIGLSIAWQAARQARHQGSRFSIAVLERDRFGAGASWAAAGMIAAGLERERGTPELSAFSRASQGAWPDFAAALEAVSGKPIALRPAPAYQVAPDPAAEEAVRARFSALAELGVPVTWLSAAALRDREPGLNPHCVGGFEAPWDFQVDNRRVLEALLAACKAEGVLLADGLGPVEVVQEAGRAVGVAWKAPENRPDSASGQGSRQARHTIRAPHLVLAAGCGSDALVPGSPPIVPVKGQIQTLIARAGTVPVHNLLWGPDIYIVPRSDGRVLLGATVEEVGYDASLTAGGIQGLLARALRTIPGLADYGLGEAWAGFRPATADRQPVLGPARLDGALWATGHYRHGFLHAPLTAQIIADTLLTGSESPFYKAFSAERFNAGAPARCAEPA